MMLMEVELVSERGVWKGSRKRRVRRKVCVQVDETTPKKVKDKIYKHKNKRGKVRERPLNRTRQQTQQINEAER